MDTHGHQFILQAGAAWARQMNDLSERYIPVDAEGA